MQLRLVSVHSTSAVTFYALAMAFSTAPAFGEFINPISQDRAIEALTEIASDEGDDSDSASDFAFDFGLFDSIVSVQSELSDVTVSATGAQTSEILMDSIYGSGFASTGGDDNPDFGMAASGSSFMAVSFEIAEALNYDLTGEISAFLSGDAEAVASFFLTGPDGTVLELFAFDGAESLNSSGSLNPGVYDLTVSAGASLFSSGAESGGSFDFNLVLSPIPEPMALGLLLIAVPILARRRR